MNDPSTIMSQSELESLKEKFRERIKSKFDPFDRSRNGSCDEREFGTILRSLGLAPSEEELARLLQDCRDDEPSSFLLYERVEMVLIQALLDHQLRGHYKMPSDEDILQAFQVLDPQKKGFIEADVLREYLSSMGEPFRYKELDDFFSVSEFNGLVEYKAYIRKLCT
ncbi:hypothetical protein RCL1_002039 [Eukaryota sp. TZLM3-RCL]